MPENILIDNGTISGEITAYPSKSQIQRVLLLGLLNKKGIEITNYGESRDSESVLSSVRRLGAEFIFFGNSFKIRGPEKLKKADIFCNESGLCLRLFAPVLSLYEGFYRIFGTEELLKRGNQRICEVLSQLGSECILDKKCLKIRGPLKSGKAAVDNPTGSQLISGLLFALSMVEGDSEIVLKNPVSFPYIEMTAKLLNQFGAEIKLDGEKKIFIKGGREFISGKVDIEGDWSSAAIFLVAGAVAGSVTVSGLNRESLQADRAITEFIKLSGAEVFSNQSSVTVSKSELKGIRADIKNCPDLFVPLVILGLNADGETKIYNYERLKDKESNRPEVIATELKKAGALIEFRRGYISVRKSELVYTELDPHNDHRIAMGMAVAALNSEGGLLIKDPECVGKSFPYFFKALNYLKEQQR
ncbi:MAG: 3-phosphoshikimate 1-carboxyvinyltransferase [Candidatus Delongbacteria bacterium]|nr:3-phosphoshikimate 1-carboxyvinyltransferase [Candidatus Delongbacteria bacterium]